MPKSMEMKLKKQAKKMGLGKKRANAYVYGTLRKTGWKPGMGGGDGMMGKEEMEKMMKEMIKRIMGKK